MEFFIILVLVIAVWHLHHEVDEIKTYLEEREKNLLSTVENKEHLP